MNRQPYIYTLPEQFLLDKSVPMRWKLFSLINGFWLSGKRVFASNAFFAEKLGCTERHIQTCLEQLEREGVLERIGVSQNRTIVPVGTNSGFVGGRTGSSKGDDPRVRHISESISESRKGVAPLRTLEEDSEVTPHKSKADPLVEKAGKYWYALCKKHIGLEPSGGLPKAMKIVKEARKSLSFPEIKKMMDDWFDEQTLEDHELVQITRCLSSFQIDKFNAEKV
jgi:hypothetical protein